MGFLVRRLTLCVIALALPCAATAQDLYSGVWRAGNDGHYLWSGVDWAGLQTKDTEVRAQNLRLVDIEPYQDGSTIRFSAVWRAGSDISSLIKANSFEELRTAVSTAQAAGLHIVDAETWLDDNVRVFAAIMRGGANKEDIAVFQNIDQLRARITQASADGLRLATIKTFKEGIRLKWLAVFNAGTDQQEAVLALPWQEFNARWQDLSQRGLRMVDFETHMEGPLRVWSGVFRAATDGHYFWVGTTWDGFQAKWRDLSQRGLRLSRIRTYGKPTNRVDRIALFQRPAVMGDSLTHGFYGVLVRPDTQAWAFPVLVQNQARADVPTAVPGIDRLNYNLLQGPGIDLPAAVPFDVHGHANTQGNCDPVCAAGNYAGVTNNGLGTRFPTAVTPVNHVGITGADFFSAVNTNDVCVNVRQTVSCRQVTAGTQTINVPALSGNIHLCNPLNSSQCADVPWQVGGQNINIPSFTTQATQCSVKKDGTSAAPTGTVSYRAKKVSLPSITIPLPWGGHKTFTPEYEVPDYPIFTQDFSVLCERNNEIEPTKQLYRDGQSLFGLRNLNHNTQMDQIEAVRPTFLMVVLGNNHVLGCAFDGDPHNPKGGCLLDANKRAFESGLDEFERRVQAIKLTPGCDPITKPTCGRLIGGAMATVPDVISIPFLKRYTGTSGCAHAPCLVPFYKTWCADESCLLNTEEIAEIHAWQLHVNERLIQVAHRLGFKVFDAARFFSEAQRVEAEESGIALKRVDAAGRPVLPDPAAVKRIRMVWPKGDGFAGGFGLDGIHPSRTGHAMLANAIITELNEQYGFEGAAAIPNIDEYTVLGADALNQHPVDLESYLGTAVTNTLREQIDAILRSIFVKR